MKKLYLHIGHGKTGSTSIQNYLDRNKNVLNEQGFFYCGINFNSLGKDKIWKESPWGFNSIPEDEFSDIYFDELVRYIDYADKLNCDFLIMSNEGYADQMNKMSAFIKKTTDHGIKVEVIYYIRHPYDWMISAYQQWGIKHKSYQGEIKSFYEFRHQGKDSPFDLTLRELNKLIGLVNLNVKINKIEEVVDNDVVKDFLSCLGVDVSGYVKELSNEKLSLTEEAFYYIYNNKQNGVTLPNKAYNLIKTLKGNKVLYRKYLKDFDFSAGIDVLKCSLDKTNELLIDKYITKNIEKKEVLDYLMFNVIENYVDLVEGVDVDRLRELAIELESVDVNISLEVMELARLFRPKGPRIIEKIKKYKKIIGNKA